MRRIKLTQGKFAIVDDEDFDWLSHWSWHLAAGGRYARTGVGPRKNHKKIYMHRLILKAKKGQEVDHINQNKLDNRKSNLRFVNRSLNNLNNFNPRKDNTSGYRGVSLDKRTNLYRARIKIGLKTEWLGYFPSPDLAHKAYMKRLNQII